MLLEIPIRINEFGSKELLDALIACSIIQDSNKRKKLIRLLDQSIANNIESTESPNDTGFSILEAFSRFPNKIDELLEAIKRLDQDSESIQYKKLHEVIFNIAREQQNQYIKSVLIPTIFGEVEGSLNDCDEKFENLWSKLYPILEEIDWKYIWEACSKIENFIQKEEVLIKSFCFTKNCKLLKQIFLDRYDSSSILIKVAELLKPYNQTLDFLLTNTHELGTNRAETDKKNYEIVFSFPPILLIIIERLGDGKNQDKWNVRGQVKIHGKIFEILLSKNKQGIDSPKFESIPTAIKSYIDYLEIEPQFRDIAIDKLRIEVFIPLFNLDSNLDNWAMVCEEEEHLSLVKHYRLFLRSRERVLKNSRIRLLKNGWDKLDVFLRNNSPEISKTTVAENIQDTQVSNMIELLEDTQISNWKELEIFMKNCSSLWGIRLKDSLFLDRFERMRFFESIFDSGIPIAFWNWESIPLQVQFEKKFTEWLSTDNLSNRCCGLLEKTWELRSILWGARTETERKQYPGYYLGMLLEDPEILPEESPLQTIGVSR